MRASGISPSFPGLSQTLGQVPHVLLTRSPLTCRGASTTTDPFDLHVLSTPPAFVLSQDQTLRQRIRQPTRKRSISNDPNPTPNANPGPATSPTPKGETSQAHFIDGVTSAKLGDRRHSAHAAYCPLFRFQEAKPTDTRSTDRRCPGRQPTTSDTEAHQPSRRTTNLAIPHRCHNPAGEILSGRSRRKRAAAAAWPVRGVPAMPGQRPASRLA